MPACATSLVPPAAHVPRDPTRTALYGLVREQRATFTSVACGEGGAPTFVRESFARFLRCGVLAHGFARFQCTSCKNDPIIRLPPQDGHKPRVLQDRATKSRCAWCVELSA